MPVRHPGIDFVVLKRMYLAGRTLRELSELTGVCRGSIIYHLRLLGVTIRSELMEMPPDEEIFRLCREGKNAREIAVALGISQDFVARKLKGIKRGNQLPDQRDGHPVPAVRPAGRNRRVPPPGQLPRGPAPETG